MRENIPPFVVLLTMPHSLKWRNKCPVGANGFTLDKWRRRAELERFGDDILWPIREHLTGFDD